MSNNIEPTKQNNYTIGPKVQAESSFEYQQDRESSNPTSSLRNDNDVSVHHDMAEETSDRSYNEMETNDSTQKLSDRNLLIQMAPEDTAGYVDAAEVYSKRGQLDDVIHITRQGMGNIQKTHPSYEVLSALNRDDNVQIRHRTSTLKTDFLMELPYDLACNIAIHLPQKTLIECIHVSKTLRDRPLNYPIL
ncbi:hypothetical protein BDA99DRAFT_100665 [Phascolomyces articulosus]|uniref:F-box domain-containing protein n=1 Tax=Phascolomyces articulosus TaxID=60185 RepID=A0AAD5PCT5_9FUNG|nr:hypothetical protein BDA99DRAFT_100665 [Phascolomyces articulosus]